MYSFKEKLAFFREICPFLFWGITRDCHFFRYKIFQLCSGNLSSPNNTVYGSACLDRSTTPQYGQTDKTILLCNVYGSAQIGSTTPQYGQTDKTILCMAVSRSAPPRHSMDRHIRQYCVLEESSDDISISISKIDIIDLFRISISISRYWPKKYRPISIFYKP